MTRNIGLAVKKPTKKPLDNENNNPFAGSLTIHGKIFEGVVTKAKAKDTVVLERNTPIYFTKFSYILINLLFFYCFQKLNLHSLNLGIQNILSLILLQL